MVQSIVKYSGLAKRSLSHVIAACALLAQTVPFPASVAYECQYTVLDTGTLFYMATVALHFLSVK